VGEDPRLHHLFRLMGKVAASDSTVLLIGESGTGKELFAELIHQLSDRSQGPLVKVNCAAFVETLLLSELFGHEKGAFTGALHRKKGRFEMAQGGTIFLDEIGDISPNTQVALLRVLQEREIERVGGAGTIPVDVRVVAATNRNLEEMVRQGTFRLDLYYRLKGVALELPALRERRGDIPLLVRHFTERYQEEQAQRRYFSHDALRLLANYNWPGNIRELENFIRSMLLFVDEPVITEAHIHEFGEFFAAGEMSADAPHLEFSRGWWLPEIQESRGEVGADVALEGGVSSEDAQPAAVEPQRPPEVAAQTPQAEAGLTPVVDPEKALVEKVVHDGMSIQDLKKRLEVECIKRALVETEGNVTHAASLLKMKRPRLSQIINGNDELGELKRKLS
jgi:transcriptional regulator with GAF, ATPase, and Fis domain